MADIEGIFEDSLLSLFQHRPVAFSTRGPDDPYLYTPSRIRRISSSHDASSEDDDVFFPVSNGDESALVPQLPPTLRIYLPTAPAALHSTLQLTHLWLSSVFMSDLIIHSDIQVRGERICELGAGAGLPGIVAARCGARSVVSTDYATGEEEGEEGGSGGVLGVLRGNFSRATTIPDTQDGQQDGAKPTGRVWDVLGHTWGDEESVARVLSCQPSASSSSNSSSTTAGEKFTLLLLADLLWSTDSHGALIASLTRLLDPDVGTAHVIAGLHQGRGPVERFLASWKGSTRGWVRHMMEVQWGHEGWEVLRDFRKGSGRVGQERGDVHGMQEDGDGCGADEHGTVVWFTIGLGHDP